MIHLNHLFKHYIDKILTVKIIICANEYAKLLSIS